MKEVDLKGYIPAIPLPMNEDFSIDERTLRAYVNWIVPQGVRALAVNVDTGEGPHLFPEERLRVLEVVAEEVNGRVPIVAGLAATFNEQAARVAKETRSAGADALLVFPIPAYQGEPLDPEIPYRYHRAVGDAADLPLICFQLQPALGGVIYSEEAIRRLLDVDHVVAIKEASFDARRFTRTVRLLQQARRAITVLNGNDNFLLEGLLLGAQGALLGFGALATQAQVKMYQAAMAGEYEVARRYAEWLQPLSDAIFAPPVRNYRARVKEALVLLGVFRNSVVRPPLPPLTDAEKAAVREALVRAGLLNGRA